MKFNLKFIYLFVILLIGLTFSCQDEVIEETPTTEEENIVPNSSLANLMRNTVTLDGSIDNIIDSANCIIVDLPVTVVVNGITITIESVEDYDAIEDIIDQFASDDDEVQIQFPIVIILSDYTEVVIENQDELESYVENCFGENEDDDDIECIDFQYPFTISIYDSTFQVIETIEINSDPELYSFIDELQGGVLASINFPINMVLANGDVIEVNTNSELEAAIAAADDTCDEDDDNDYDDDDECNIYLDGIEAFLYECAIEAYVYDANNDIIDVNQLEFVQNSEVIVNGTPAVTEVGTWTLNETDSGYVLNITGLNTFDLINGDWVLTGCESGHLTFIQDTGSGMRTLLLEHDCNSNTGPLGCLEANNIALCDENNDGFEVFNLYEGLSEISGCTINNPIAVSFHTTLVDAESNVNPILSATSYTNTTNPQTVYVRIEVLNNPSQFEILEIGLLLEDCTGSNCTESEIDAYLVDCTWNIVNFNGDDNLIDWDLDFSSDGSVIIAGDGMVVTTQWSTTTTSEGVIVTFSGVALPNIQAINGDWLVEECQEGRLEFSNNANDNMVMERDCTGSGGTVQDLEDIIIDGQWFVANYNDSGIDETDNYNGYILDFNSDGTVTVANGSQTISGVWNAFLDNTELKLLLDFGTTMPFDEFNDDWDVVSLTSTGIALRDISGGSGETDLLVFERI